MSEQGTLTMNNPTDDEVTKSKSKQSIWLRLWPIYLIAAAIGLVFAMGWHEVLSLETLRDQRAQLTTFVDENFLLALLVFVVIYVLATVLMVPGALWITISGGFMFGVAIGSLGTVVGATLGASTLFMAARTSIGKALHERAGPWLQKMESGFREDAISYMFALRLLPIVPFPVANIAPALLGARYPSFVFTTFFGVLPAVVAYSWLGAGLGATFDAGEELDVVGFFRNFAPAFAALGVVALIPPFYKRFISKKPTPDTSAEEA